MKKIVKRIASAIVLGIGFAIGYCEEDEPNRVCEKLNEMNPDEYQVVKFKVRLKD